MKIRSFVAIEVPTTIQDEIFRQTTQFRKLYPSPIIRWVKPDNIHLTLKFLGDISLSDLESINFELVKETSIIKPFFISFTHLGVFPNPLNPRILWIGVKSPEILGELHRSIERIVSRFGIESEKRPFSPHLTLGRIATKNSFHNLENFFYEMEMINVSNIEKVIISSMKIFKSDLKPGGPFYSVIHNIPFGEN